MDTTQVYEDTLVIMNRVANKVIADGQQAVDRIISENGAMNEAQKAGLARVTGIILDLPVAIAGIVEKHKAFPDDLEVALTTFAKTYRTGLLIAELKQKLSEFAATSRG